MNLNIRAEDIMTPRRLLVHARTDAEAEAVARKERFEAVPIIGDDGLVRKFWSLSAQQRTRITRRHSVAHDQSVDRLLPALGAHVVQFVFYRSELVGLVDASDLNKPISCLAWLQPMLELERAILDAVKERGIADEQQAAALGQNAKSALSLQRRARRHDLVLPLLEYVLFGSLLRAARTLKLSALSDEDIDLLKEMRNRAAHAGDPIIQDRSDCLRLQGALSLARAEASSVSGRNTTSRIR